MISGTGARQINDVTEFDVSCRSNIIQTNPSSSSSIGSATLVGFRLLNYGWVFSAGRCLQDAFTSVTSNPQIGGPVIRTFKLPPPGVLHAWNDESELQQWKGEKLPRILPKSGDFNITFWVLLHAVYLRHGTDGFISPPKEGVLRIFSPEKSDGFGRVWTRELVYQRPADLPLDHRSRDTNKLPTIFNVLQNMISLLVAACEGTTVRYTNWRHTQLGVIWRCPFCWC